MVTIRAENSSDVAAREALLNRAFGVKRFRKTSEKLRSGRLPAVGLAFSAVDEKGKLVGTIRLWNIIAGSAGQALLLGPLAVDSKAQGHGIGAALMNHAWLLRAILAIAPSCWWVTKAIMAVLDFQARARAVCTCRGRWIAHGF